MTDSDTVFIQDAHNIGSSIHILFRSKSGSEIADVVVASEIYAIFDAGKWTGDYNKRRLLRLFSYFCLYFIRTVANAASP